MAGVFDFYAGLADTFPFEEPAEADHGRRVRPARARAGRRGRGDHPVERPDQPDLLQSRTGPARRLHRRPQVLARGAGAAYLFAEIAEDIGLPPGVLNVVTADREVSELLVRNPASTRSRSPARPRPAGASPPSAASGSPAARSSSAASPPP